MPSRKEDLPSTLERSSKKVQRTYEKALDNAHEQYRSEERAHRTAWSAVKHVAKKEGDHWTLKDEKGPSNPQAKQSGRQAREKPKKTAGGIDVEGSSKDELYDRAKELGIEGRSKMNKRELERAVERASGRSRAKREKANPIEVQRFLEGVNYPTRKADLVREAERQGANKDVRATLARIRDEKFDSPADVSEAIGRLS